MIRDLYPLSTPDGKAIPLDIIRPRGVFRIPIGQTASILYPLVDTDPIVILRSTVGCFVRFGEVAIIPSTAMISNQLYLAAGDITIVSPHVQSLSAISESSNGFLTVQLLDKWMGLAAEVNYNRR